MMPAAILFDMDGTLVDTNAAHVEAWRRAMQQMGYDVGAERIIPQIGKGGDQLVPAVLGREADEKDGAALRRAHPREFAILARTHVFAIFPGARELIDALKRRELRTVIATSSKKHDLKTTLDAVGVDITDWVDKVITADDADQSKPAPDVVNAALAALDVAPAQAAMIGDTPFDVEACRAAGVACLTVTCGGTADADRLLAAGARGVYRDPADILANLDDALRRCE